MSDHMIIAKNTRHSQYIFFKLKKKKDLPFKACLLPSTLDKEFIFYHDNHTNSIIWSNKTQQMCSDTVSNAQATKVLLP